MQCIHLWRCSVVPSWPCTLYKINGRMKQKWLTEFSFTHTQKHTHTQIHTHTHTKTHTHTQIHTHTHTHKYTHARKHTHTRTHLFLCLHCLRPPFTVPFKMVLARPDEWETWLYNCSLRLFTIIRSSCGPMACWILARTSSLVTWSLYEMCSILR